LIARRGLRGLHLLVSSSHGDADEACWHYAQCMAALTACSSCRPMSMRTCLIMALPATLPTVLMNTPAMPAGPAFLTDNFGVRRHGRNLRALGYQPHAHKSPGREQL